jgi:hypothetical protein
MDPKQLFHTRERANAGVRVPLFQPDGAPTEHWLLVRGIDSDEWHKAQSASRQRLMAAASSPEKIQQIDPEEERVVLVASLVAGWSFEGEATPDAVKAFLREAPQIITEVDKIASNRARFFGGSSSSSTPTPPASSS